MIRFLFLFIFIFASNISYSQSVGQIPPKIDCRFHASNTSSLNSCISNALADISMFGNVEVDRKTSSIGSDTLVSIYYCRSGLVLQNGVCSVNSCVSGEQVTQLIPIGWATYYTGNSGEHAVEGGGSASIVGSPVVPSSICMGGCSYSVGDWQGQINFDAPSGSGSYQVVANSSLTGSGSVCSQNTDLSMPSNPAPVCSGDVGIVNGKQVCASSQPGGGGGETGGGETGGGETGGGETGGGETGGGETGGGETGGGETGGGSSGGGSSGGGSSGGGSSGGGSSGGGSGEGTGEGEGAGTGAGAALGDWKVPKFYETKFPNGMDDVWSESGIQASSDVLKGLTSAFVPPWADTKGSCQSFALSLDIGIVNFGRFDMSPPCMIWPFLWICIHIGAIFLFRALVFGG